MNFNMPGVYKIHMVRMYNNTDELANVRVAPYKKLYGENSANNWVINI